MNDNDIKKYKIWVYDFEVYSKINWFCVTFIDFYDDNNIVEIVNDRKKLIEFYNKHKENIFVGYNSRQYDVGIFKGLLDNLSVGFVNDKIIKEGKKVFQVVKNYKKYQLYDYDAVSKDKSLKQLEAFMGDDIRETEVDFNIDRPLTDKEIQQTLFYNHHDVVELKKVLKYTWDDFEGQINIIDLYNLPLEHISKTKVQLACKILNVVDQHTLDDEFDIRLPDTIQISDKYKFIAEWYLKPENWRYKEYLHSEDEQHNNQLCCNVAGIPHVFAWGGCHGADDKQSVFEGIILHADVSAMYPTIDIEYNLLSRKFKNPEDFRKMKDFRLKLKSEGNPKNKSLKPMINGTYGASKDRQGAMYDPLMANLTCIFGQMILLDLIDKIEPYCHLIQSNTDGIYFQCDNNELKNKTIEIINETGKRLKMEFEIDEYTKLIQKDVNNYIAVPKNPKQKIECKGKMVKFNSPIDNDLPILNDAVRNYLVSGTPVEDTINNCTELIKFQKVIKLSAKYKEVWHGMPIVEKINNKESKMTIDGVQLVGKVHRVFASNNALDGAIYKSKMEKGKKTYEKFADTPDHIFINNNDIHDESIPMYLDRNYYIEEAKKRINMFLTKDEEKVDPIPELLFSFMNKSSNVYDFLECVANSEVKIGTKLLTNYIIADCCKTYGKTQKILTFYNYFNILYGLNKLVVSSIKKKITDENILSIVFSNAIKGKTGKTYTEFNYKKALLEILDTIEDTDINAYDIMVMQIKLFNQVRYTDPECNDNRWFVLNTRNVIKPNINIYNLKTGEIQYRKVQKEIFTILPLYDGDIFDILSSEMQYGNKIIGKDEKGVNILAADIDKEYDVITSYDIVYRDIKTTMKHKIEEEF